jgi:hypothetical protein
MTPGIKNKMELGLDITVIANDMGLRLRGCFADCLVDGKLLTGNMPSGKRFELDVNFPTGYADHCLYHPMLLFFFFY